MEKKLTYQVCLLRDGEEVAMEHGKSCIRFDNLQAALTYYNRQLRWLRGNYDYKEITPDIAPCADEILDDLQHRGTCLQFCVYLDDEGLDVDDSNVAFYFTGKL